MSRDQNSQHREISDGLVDWRENGNPPAFEGRWAGDDDDDWDMYEWGDALDQMEVMREILELEFDQERRAK